MDRVLVSLAPGTEASRVAASLRKLGATSAPEPAPELPDVIVAEAPRGRSREFLAAAARIPGVVAAEEEVLSYTQRAGTGPDEPAETPPAKPVRRGKPAAPATPSRPATPDEPDLPPGWSSTEPE